MAYDEVPSVSYSLFAQDGEEGLCCAVRQDQPVPAFVAHWQFRGTVNGSLDAPPDFRPHAAQAATQLTGYYLFVDLRGARRAA